MCIRTKKKVEVAPYFFGFLPFLDLGVLRSCLWMCCAPNGQLAWMPSKSFAVLRCAFVHSYSSLFSVHTVPSAYTRNLTTMRAKTLKFLPKSRINTLLF